MTRKRSGSREESPDRRTSNRRGRDRSADRNERDRKRYEKCHLLYIRTKTSLVISSSTKELLLFLNLF